MCAHAPICFKSHTGFKPTCFNDATSGGCHWKLLIFYNVYFLYFPIFPQWTCICIVFRKTCVIINYFSGNLLWKIHLWHKVKRVCITFLANKEASEAGLLTGSLAIIVPSGGDPTQMPQTWAWVHRTYWKWQAVAASAKIMAKQVCAFAQKGSNVSVAEYCKYLGHRTPTQSVSHKPPPCSIFLLESVSGSQTWRQPGSCYLFTLIYCYNCTCQQWEKIFNRNIKLAINPLAFWRILTNQNFYVPCNCQT